MLSVAEKQIIKGLLKKCMGEFNLHPKGINSVKANKALCPDLSDDLFFSWLKADGSSRRFVRIERKGYFSLLAVLPDNLSPNLAESLSTCKIGKHLYKHGIPVPRIYAFDQESGIIIVEDCGDCRLDEYVKTHGKEENEEILSKVVSLLAKMQTTTFVNFPLEYCWDGKIYDTKLMLERESGYFVNSFCKDFLDISSFESSLDSEFIKLASFGSAIPANYFLHRDFQSRNIMICNNEIRIIDFQGGRQGPLAYDLASFIIDPYLGLEKHLRLALIEQYIKELNRWINVEPDVFWQGYSCLALQRNLQILAAYAFLSQKKGKFFFRQFIEPAMETLMEQLSEPFGEEFPALRALAAKCHDNYLHQKAVSK
jgi:N-acetylmuramate 1-kinase